MTDEKLRKKRRRLIRLRRMFGLFVLIVLGAVVCLNWDYLSPEAILLKIQRMGSLTGTTADYPLDISGRVVAAVGRLGNQGLLVTDSGYYRLKPNKAEEFSHSLQSVSLSTAGDYAILYEKGGSDYILESAGGRIFENSIGGTIRMAEVAPNGNYALLLQVTNYASKLNVYNSSGKQLFSNFTTGSKISGISFNKNGSLCAVTTVDTQGGGLVSTVTIYNISSGEQVKTLTLTDLLCIRVYFQNDGGLCITCDESAIFYNSSFEEKARVDYKNRSLLAYAWDDGDLALLFQTDDPLSGRSVEVYRSGELLYRIDSDRKAKGISLQKGRLSILDKEELLVYQGENRMMEKAAAAGSARTLLVGNSVFEIAQNQVAAYRLNAAPDDQNP